MLAPMAVLFVEAEERADIKIAVRDIQPGWKVDGTEEVVRFSTCSCIDGASRI